MKETVQKRQIKPRSGRGKPREGLLSRRVATPENRADFKEITENSQPTYDPTFRLERLIDSTKELLKDLPAPDQKFLILDDGSWRAAPDNVTNYSLGIDKNSTLVEPLSPEYFALDVRLWATFALERLKEHEYQRAIIPIMEAQEAHWRMVFADQLEYQLTGKIASDQAVKQNSRSNEWAMSLAEHLCKLSSKGKSKPPFKIALRYLVEGEQPILHAGLIIYYESATETLTASRPGDDASMGDIKLDTFRTSYYRKV